MNLELAKKKLEKINRLIETFEPGENHVSRLERDLIMSYTREFYDAITEISNGSFRAATRTSPPKEKTAPRPHQNQSTGQKIQEEIILQKYTETRKETEKEVSSSHFEEAITDEPVIEKKVAPKPSAESVIEQIKPAVETVEVPAVKIEEPASPEPTNSTIGRSITQQELQDLFAIKKANEISEKLSQLPITDLNKAMGVNEKIFVKNELFGGDDNLFRSTLSKLNTFENFDQAKDFLSNEVAASYEWTAPDKSKKAKNFIQLVYRRYK
jgi:hypothetical protein